MEALAIHPQGKEQGSQTSEAPTKVRTSRELVVGDVSVRVGLGPNLLQDGAAGRHYLDFPPQTPGKEDDGGDDDPDDYELASRVIQPIQAGGPYETGGEGTPGGPGHDRDGEDVEGGSNDDDGRTN